MRRLPVIAIVGRPNVGKSSFFNAVLGRRVSIVDAAAGVTRDRVSAETSHQGRTFELLDTGGLGLFDEVLLKEEVERQIWMAITLADAIFFLVDIRDGLTPLDEEVARSLRRLDKPVVLVANKADTPFLAEQRHVFHALGLGEPLAASASEKRGLGDALDRALSALPPDGDPAAEVEGAGDAVKIAVVGCMNAGKSSLVNTLAGQERMIVSEHPGTTRDSVDVAFEQDGQRFVAIDTAGLRRKKAIQDSVEFYGQARAERAVRRADGVILLIDATREISTVDKKIADLVVSSYKPCVVAVSKWDLAKSASPGDFETYVSSRLPGLEFAPLSFLSSKTGFNVAATFALALELCAQASQRVGTAEINRVLEEAQRRRAPQLRKSRLARIYFGSQVEVRPPTILVFVNDIRLFNRDYRRYLANRFREALPFKEVPIKIAFRGKDRVGAPRPKGAAGPRKGDE